MSVTYQLSQAAYCKAVLHALKYPSQAVNGVLIGSGGSGQTSPRGDKAVEVVDAVPLFHTRLSLAPMLEVALTQVRPQPPACRPALRRPAVTIDVPPQIDSYFAKKGLCIVGYYHGNERADDKDLGLTAKRIGDKIVGTFPDACVLLLDNHKMASALSNGAGLPLTLYTKEGGVNPGWKLAGENPLNPSELKLKEGTPGGALVGLVEEGRQGNLSDFDDHLEDITRDWLNPSLLA
mmetsp:Transcript_41099/g.131484  ORF Transcript_41099/g.131484 Transcript_41099/m.131484 type:complete len:235 (+) Transcript_41099:1177-1881(+)